MGFFNKYPYTDCHELNLDWILSKVKELTLNNEAFYANVKANVDKYLAENLTQVLAELSLGKVNVKAFGAYGDGSHIDTPFINLAIQSMTKGGTLFFPAGTYLIDDIIDLEDEFKISLELDNAIIKQTVRLEPMIRVGSGDATNNYPQKVYGVGVVDMDSLGGIGIQIANNGGYACVENIQVRACSYGIGIQMGDSLTGDAVSLQAELNNVKIYGTDSALPGTGLYINAYDCVFNNLYLYLCKIGCQTYHGGHNFSYVHVWGHSYDPWNTDDFKATIGFKMRGTSFFNTLYLDSVYTGIQTNGYDQLINNCFYTSDIHDELTEDTVGRVVERERSENVTINNGLFYNPHTYKMQVFYINNNENVAAVTAGHMCLCNHVVQSFEKWIPFDEANNIPVNNNRANPVRRSALEANTAYLLGYLKLSGANDINLRVSLKESFTGSITARLTNTAIDTYNTSYEVVFTGANTVHVYYGTAVEYDGIKWLPIYLSAETAGTYLPIIECNNNGDSGFYPCYAESFSELDTSVISGLTEFTE